MAEILILGLAVVILYYMIQGKREDKARLQRLEEVRNLGISGLRRAKDADGLLLYGAYKLHVEADIGEACEALSAVIQDFPPKKYPGAATPGFRAAEALRDFYTDGTISRYSLPIYELTRQLEREGKLKGSGQLKKIREPSLELACDYARLMEQYVLANETSKTCLSFEMWDRCWPPKLLQWASQNGDERDRARLWTVLCLRCDPEEVRRAHRQEFDGDWDSLREYVERVFPSENSGAEVDRNIWISKFSSVLEEAVETMNLPPYSSFPGANRARPFGVFGLGLSHLWGVQLGVAGFSATACAEFLKQAKELGVGQIGGFMDELRRACAEPGLVRESDVESMHDDIPVQQFENLEHLFAKCDSKPERLLLDALVRRARLKLDGGKLAGDLILHVQPTLGKFRVDFLVNEDLVVEIDGHAFHGDKRSFEVDRLRDQELILRGLRVIRFPAKQVFLNPDDVADIVMKAATSSKQF